MCLSGMRVCILNLYLRPSCLSPVSVGSKAPNERHRLQISPWLPAPELEIDTFPAAFVELCYLLALKSPPLTHLNIAQQATIHHFLAQTNEFTNPQNYLRSHSIKLLSLREEFALECDANQTQLSDKIVRDPVLIFPKS